MQGSGRGLTSGAVFHLALWWCCGIAAAQQVGPSGPAETVPAAAGPPVAARTDGIEESKLPFYLRDKDGKLVAMPGWTFEEFEQLYQRSQGLAEPDLTPRWVIESMSAAGTARGSHAELSVTLGIVLGDDRPVQVPLRLDQAVLRAPLGYDGPGQPLVFFDDRTGGYVAVLQGKPRQPIQLTLTVLVPLVKLGGENRLALACPRAAQSSLTLEVPLPEAAAEVSEGAVLTSSSATDHGTTQLEVQGLAGAFQLTWRRALSRGTPLGPVVEAIGDISAVIDMQRVHTQATLTVRAFGAPLDRFRVRLPQHAELVPSESADYTVEPVARAPGGGKSASNAQGPRVVEVKLSHEAAEQVILLETRQSLDAVGPTGWFPLGGFEVLEATRQWGQIDVSVVGDLYVFWGPQQGVEQVERTAAAGSEEQMVGAFDYHGQPFALSVRVAPRKTRLTVEPQYVLLVDGDRATLQATLKYAVRGAKVSSLDVHMPGWTIDDAGPYEELVAMGGVAVDGNGLVSVALTEPMIGDLTVTLAAHQEIEQQGGRLTLAIPQPQADSVGPASVAVLPADNVDLIPDTEQTTGLIQQQVVPAMTLPERHQPPLYYRAEKSEAVFAATVERHERTIAVDLTSEVDLLAERQWVQQTLTYQVEYERIQELEFEVPAAVAASGTWEVFLDGQPLAPAASSEAAVNDPATGPLLRRLVLPEPRIGPIRLVVRYPIEIEELRPETSIRCEIPLLMPGQGELLSNTVVVRAAPGVRIAPQQGPWKPVVPETPDSPQEETLRLAADGKADRVVLGVSLESRDALGSVVVERAWIQTWITSNVRQDRAVFRFVADQKNVEIALPGGVELDRLSLALDGVPAESRKTPQGSLAVSLGEGGEGKQHLLEVWYQIRQAHGGPGRLSVELPQLGREFWVQRTYWQLNLPADEHVIAVLGNLTPEYRWGWNGAFWGRVPLLGQRELEEWLGVRPVEPPTNGSSCYLFGNLGAIRQCELRTAGRPLIVLVTSGLTLVLGLAWIYVPAARHPAALLVACVVLLSAALLYPGPMLLLLEAASLGVVLILLAGLLHRSVARRRGTLPGEMSSSILDRGSTRTVRPAPPKADGDSAQPPPDAVPLSIPDSQS